MTKIRARDAAALGVNGGVGGWMGSMANADVRLLISAGSYLSNTGPDLRCNDRRYCLVDQESDVGLISDYLHRR